MTELDPRNLIPSQLVPIFRQGALIPSVIFRAIP